MKTAVLRAIERIERDFHRRAFGEELARVHLLPPAERRAYLARLRRRAASRRRPLGDERRLRAFKTRS